MYWGFAKSVVTIKQHCDQVLGNWLHSTAFSALSQKTRARLTRTTQSNDVPISPSPSTTACAYPKRCGRVFVRMACAECACLSLIPPQPSCSHAFLQRDVFCKVNSYIPYESAGLIRRANNLSLSKQGGSVLTSPTMLLARCVKQVR